MPCCAATFCAVLTSASILRVCQYSLKPFSLLFVSVTRAAEFNHGSVLTCRPAGLCLMRARQHRLLAYAFWRQQGEGYYLNAGRGPCTARRTTSSGSCICMTRTVSNIAWLIKLKGSSHFAWIKVCTASSLRCKEGKAIATYCTFLCIVL